MSKKKYNFNPKVLELLNELNVSSLSEMNEVINELKKGLIEKALDEELTEHLGYEKWDQNSREKSDNYRNGHSRKTVKSNSGEIELSIPRDEMGTFEPKIVKKYQNNISEIDEKIIFMFSKGMSTRDISECIQEIYGMDISKDFISRVTDKILPDIQAWLSRPLKKIYPIVYIDGIRFQVKENNQFIEKSIYIAIGVNSEGIKDVLGFWISESESAKYWMNVFNDLKSRGVQEILIVCSDNLTGISEAIKAVFPKTDIQKCIVHQIRNSTKFVRYDHLKEFCSDMKKIYSAPNLDVALNELDIFENKWNSKYSYAIKSWRNNIDELTTFFKYPFEIRKIIYTTNTIENLNRNIRKITKTKGNFTNAKSLEKLVYLVIQNQLEKWNSRIPNWGIIYQQLKIIFNDNELLE
ncbi:MAG: IS256 family transposase [Ureaplasma sp.]|nr:IS256 family transposase [Ureaplasma sp.]